MAFSVVCWPPGTFSGDDDDADNDDGQSCSWDNRKDGEPASPGKWSNTRSGITNVKCGKRKL